MKYENILFDLDGTITDPKIGITNSIKYALSKFNILEPDQNKFAKLIGPPLESIFREIYGFSKPDATLAIKYYREYFSDKGIYENVLYSGIYNLLEKLCQNKKNLIIATSKPTVFAERVVNHFKINKFFNSIVGSQLDGTMSDKTEIIKYILDTNKYEPDKTVMIGDRKHDIIGAQNNSIDSIAVGYGFGSEKEIDEHKPTYVCMTMQDLINFLTL